MEKMLKFEDLRVGLEVNVDQLDDIYDTYILVGNQKHDGNTVTGTIVAFSKDKCKLLVDAIDMCKQKYGQRPYIHIQKSNHIDGWYDV
jgi:hypothetical protein